MKNVAIINATNGGSTGNIGINIYNALKARGANPIFCYSVKNQEIEIPENNYCFGKQSEIMCHAYLTKLTGLHGCFTHYSTYKLLKLFSKLNIDTLFLVNIHCYTINEKMVFDYAAKHNLKVIYIQIDEYSFVGRCCYSQECDAYLTGCKKCRYLDKYHAGLIDTASILVSRKKKAYDACKHLAFVGPLCVTEKAEKSYLLKNRNIFTIDEAINVDIFKPRDNKLIKEKLNIPQDKIIILCAAPSVERKGFKYYLECARSLEHDQRFLFYHVGYQANEKLPANYRPIPFIHAPELLADYMSVADLFVFPSVADSMPNACLDAMACGTPLLCFDLPGMSCMGGEPILKVVEPRNQEALNIEVSKAKPKSQEMINMCREYAVARYDERKYAQKVLDFAETV